MEIWEIPKYMVYKFLLFHAASLTPNRIYTFSELQLTY